MLISWSEIVPDPGKSYPRAIAVEASLVVTTAAMKLIFSFFEERERKKKNRGEPEWNQQPRDFNIISQASVERSLIELSPHRLINNNY